jgi:hypothetical protein
LVADGAGQAARTHRGDPTYSGPSGSQPVEDQPSGRRSGRSVRSVRRSVRRSVGHGAEDFTGLSRPSPISAAADLNAGAAVGLGTVGAHGGPRAAHRTGRTSSTAPLPRYARRREDRTASIHVNRPKARWCRRGPEPRPAHPSAPRTCPHPWARPKDTPSRDGPPPPGAAVARSLNASMPGGTSPTCDRPTDPLIAACPRKPRSGRDAPVGTPPPRVAHGGRGARAVGPSGRRAVGPSGRRAADGRCCTWPVTVAGSGRGA